MSSNYWDIHEECSVQTFKIHHYFSNCHKPALAMGRHSIAAILETMGLQVAEIARRMSNPNYLKERTGTYGDLQTHKALIFTKDEEYAGIYKSIKEKENYVIFYMGVRMERDLKTCYCIDQAYEMGVQDAVKKINELFATIVGDGFDGGKVEEFAEKIKNIEIN